MAKEYIAKGALWNGGVFAFRLGYLIQKAHELIDFTDYQDLFAKYEALQKISFDYAVGRKSLISVYCALPDNGRILEHGIP